MAAHARLKNEFTEDEKYHNLLRWLILSLTLCRGKKLIEKFECLFSVCVWHHCYKGQDYGFYRTTWYIGFKTSIWTETEYHRLSDHEGKVWCHINSCLNEASPFYLGISGYMGYLLRIWGTCIKEFGIWDTENYFWILKISILWNGIVEGI